MSHTIQHAVLRCFDTHLLMWVFMYIFVCALVYLHFLPLAFNHLWWRMLIGSREFPAGLTSKILDRSKAVLEVVELIGALIGWLRRSDLRQWIPTKSRRHGSHYVHAPKEWPQHWTVGKDDCLRTRAPGLSWTFIKGKCYFWLRLRWFEVSYKVLCLSQDGFVRTVHYTTVQVCVCVCVFDAVIHTNRFVAMHLLSIPSAEMKCCVQKLL